MVRSWRVSSALQVTDPVDVVPLPRLDGRALAALSQDPAVVLVRAARDVEELPPVAALLVGAAVADLARAQEALRAVDVLDPVAEPVAVPVAAPDARCALGRAVAADPGEPAVLPVDALVGASVAPLEGLVGVLPYLAGDRREADANLLRDRPFGLSGREAELDAAPLGAAHLLLSFFHSFSLLCLRRDWRRGRMIAKCARQVKCDGPPPWGRRVHALSLMGLFPS